MKPLVIVGCSAHGRVVLDILRASKSAVVAGWVDDSGDFQGTEIEGIPVLGRIADLPAIQGRLGTLGVIVAVGDNAVRARCTRRISDLCPGIAFGTAVHPSAVIAPRSVLGSGSVVAAGAVVNPGARVGVGCLINTRASLDHDCTMEDFSSLAPGVVVGGAARIGAETAVGIGAVVANGITIGSRSVIGAGAVAVRSIPDGVVAFGVPARVIRSRQPDEPYLTAHLRPQ